MTTILYMAISADGKTTGANDDVSWVSEADIGRMDALMTSCGVQIMGSATYSSFGADLPNNQALQVVMTHNAELLAQKRENVIFTDQDPSQVLAMLADKGFETAMLAGGQTLNASFLSANLIDQIWLLCKPIILGQGNSLFAESLPRNLQLLECTTLEHGAVEFKYAVNLHP